MLSGDLGRKKATAGHMREEARQVSGDESCLMIGEQKFRIERKKDDTDKHLNRQGENVISPMIQRGRK